MVVSPIQIRNNDEQKIQNLNGQNKLEKKKEVKERDKRMERNTIQFNAWKIARQIGYRKDKNK